MTDLERINLITLTILEKTEEPVKVSLSDIIGEDAALEMVSKKEITL